MKVTKLLVTRKEVRELGLSYSNTHFIRLERMGLLTPVKLPFRSAVVRYRYEEVLDLIHTYTVPREPLSEE